jgi:hypothetical protein
MAGLGGNLQKHILKEQEKHFVGKRSTSAKADSGRSESSGRLPKAVKSSLLVIPQLMASPPHYQGYFLNRRKGLISPFFVRKQVLIQPPIYTVLAIHQPRPQTLLCPKHPQHSQLEKFIQHRLRCSSFSVRISKLSVVSDGFECEVKRYVID